MTAVFIDEKERPCSYCAADVLPVIDDRVFDRFSYGVEIMTTHFAGRDYGCVLNTAGQIASAPIRKISISIVKDNLSCEIVRRAGEFNLSILTSDVPFELIRNFGFRSGRDTDKFEDIEYDNRTSNGIRYIPVFTNSVLSCVVTDIVDVGTQLLFIADVVEARVLSDAPSCTYAYYRAKIKPKTAPSKEPELREISLLVH